MPPLSEDRINVSRLIRSVPTRFWAPAGVFIVVLFLIIFLTPPSQPKPQPTAARPDKMPSVSVTAEEPPSPALKVYTFPQSSNASPLASPSMPVPSVDVPKPRISVPEVRPASLPKINQELTLVAEPKAAPKKPAVEPAKPADKPAPENETAPTGGTLLAQAIRLHDQGKTSEAIGTANQAIVLFQRDIDAGKGTEMASRGIQNARRLISVW